MINPIDVESNEFSFVALLDDKHNGVELAIDFPDSNYPTNQPSNFANWISKVDKYVKQCHLAPIQNRLKNLDISHEFIESDNPNLIQINYYYFVEEDCGDGFTNFWQVLVRFFANNSYLT